MKLFGYLRDLMDRLLHRRQIADELEEELCEHIAMRADDLERSGVPHAEAERRARIELGASARFREEGFEVLGGNVLETTLRDVRLALRVLRKSPGFTAAGILTLALAIGANAVVFGLMDGLVLRPLNLPQIETLHATQYGDGSGFQSYVNYKDLRARNHSFEDVAAFNFAFVGLDRGNDPAIAVGFEVTGNYFDVLRMQPYLGRLIHETDEHGPNSAPYIVLSYPYWHSRFQSDAKVVGQVVQINRHPFTVVGVTPRGFRGTISFISPDFFLPIIDDPMLSGRDAINQRSSINTVFEVMGHLKPGITQAQAAADVNSIAVALQKQYPREVQHKDTKLPRAGLTSFGDAVRAFMAGLMLLSGLILLAACANLGSLFAAHAADRSREVALRLALGSTRTRILRQLLTEALIISIAGGAIGLAGSVALLRWLAQWQPFPGAPIHLPLTPDVRLYSVALALALLSGFLFGIVPVRQVLRSHPYEVVKAGAGERIGKRIGFRDVLLVAQIAICAVLVTASMVAVRGLMRTLQSNFGFEPRNAMVLSADLTTTGRSAKDALATEKHIANALQAIPGVEHVGWLNTYPPLVYTSATRTNLFRDETTDLTPSKAAERPYTYGISPGYLEAAQTALLAGRDFRWDDENRPAVVLVNRELARRMFGSINGALGRSIRQSDGTRSQIIGVMEDGKYLTATEDAQPAMFVSVVQRPANSAYMVVRSKRDPQELAAAMRRALREAEPGLPPSIQSWEGMLAVALFPARMAAAALGVLGLMGAILSITGVFGMAAFSVNRRLKELGIRVALGARRTEVLGTALSRALRVLAIGSISGLVLGVLASRVLAAIVFQATPRDPVVLAAVVLAMLILGVLATWIPAQRALAVNPLVLLREE